MTTANFCGGIGALRESCYFMDRVPKKSETFSDDAFAFTNMSGDWLPWNRGFSGWRSRRKLKKQEKVKVKTDKKEFRAAVGAQYLAMLPALICVLVGFGVVYALLRLWLM